MLRLQVIALALFAGIALGKDPPPRPPPGWGAFLKLDREFNISTRPLMNARDAEVCAIYTVDIPQEETERVESEFLDTATKRWVYLEKDGKKFVRFYFAEHPLMKPQMKKLETLRSRGYAVEQKYWGALMQSHSTFFMWDPKAPQEAPLFLKLARQEGPSATEDTYNSFVNAQVAVANNDSVEKVLRDSGNPRIRVFPERFGAQLKIEGVEYSYSVRSAVPSGEAVGEDTILYPLHGLLGSAPHLKAFAEKSGMDVATWIEKEYLPKLAKFVSDTQFKQGLYFVAHTQNLLVYIDKQTGRIESFVARDMNDVMQDVHARLAQGKDHHLESGWTSGVNDFFVDTEVPKAKYAGWNMALYLKQSVGTQAGGEGQRQQTTAKFLRMLMAEAEAITGTPVRLSPKGQQAFAEIESGSVRMDLSLIDRMKVFLGEERRFLTGPTARFGFVAQEIYDHIAEFRLPQLTVENLSYDPAVLKGIFDQQREAERVAMVRYRADERVDRRGIGYAFDGKGVIAFERKNGRAVAYAFDLTHEQIQRARGAPGSPESQNWCPWGWKRLTQWLGWRSVPSLVAK